MHRWAVIIGIIGVVLSCSKDKEANPAPVEKVRVYACGAESKEGDQFKTNNGQFFGGNSQSETKALNGKFSSMTTPEEQNGMGIEIPNLKPGNYIVAEVHKAGATRLEGGLVLSNESGTVFLDDARYYGSESIWLKVALTYEVPEGVSKLKCYVRGESGSTMFFDDLKIMVFPTRPVGGEGLPVVDLKLDNDTYGQLDKYAKKARKNGVIKKKYKKSFAAEMNTDQGHHAIDVRLKGDWPDHAQDRKWSFRIKLTDETNYMGMREFSVQSPETRSFLSEWLAHDVMRDQGIIAPRYEFVQLRVNGENWGVYALEEHFDKTLIESHQRREGPILKFNEDGVWKRYLASLKDPNYLKIPVFEEAEIEPFKPNRTVKDSTLNHYFLEGQNLMLKYKSMDPDIEDYLDLDKWAKYYAVSELLGLEHGLIWHNQRVYYNPVTSLLEPIAFDCFPEAPVAGETTIFPILSDTVSPEKAFHYRLLQHPEFVAFFQAQLDSYTDGKGSIQRLISRLSDKWDELEESFRPEFPHYRPPDFTVVVNRGHHLTRAKELSPGYADRVHSIEQVVAEDVCSTDLHLKAVGIHTYTQRTSEKRKTLLVKNFHPCGVDLYQYENSDGDTHLEMEDSFHLDYLDEMELPARVIWDRISYFPKNTDPERPRIYRRKILPWPAPKKESSFGAFRKSSYQLAEVFNVRGRVLTFKSNRVQLNKNLYIPQGYVLKVKAGTQIDLRNESAIVSKSSVQCLGTEEQPIQITSEDATGRGLLIINTDSSNIFRNVTVSTLKHFQYEKWKVTGVVTCYASDVYIDDMTFQECQGEDVLNLVNCSFNLRHVDVRQGQSDGIDIDFGYGTLQDCFIGYMVNDGLDISGADVTVSNCTFKKCDDKGISVGEGATVKLIDCKMIDCVVGVASKDKSVVNVERGRIERCWVAVQAYQKKPEFGRSHIQLDGTAFHMNKTDFERDEKSRIRRDGVSPDAREVTTVVP